MKYELVRHELNRTNRNFNRGLSVDNYTVFFKIKGNTVQIRRILYGARNYEFLL